MISEPLRTDTISTSQQSEKIPVVLSYIFQARKIAEKAILALQSTDLQSTPWIHNTPLVLHAILVSDM